MDKSYLPVNPCPNCIDSKGGCSGSCDQKWDCQAEVAGQKKLLGYLIAESKITGAKITLGRFYEMLKELEVKP